MACCIIEKDKTIIFSQNSFYPTCRGLFYLFMALPQLKQTTDFNKLILYFNLIHNTYENSLQPTV
jgi:hypothetical protein